MSGIPLPWTVHTSSWVFLLPCRLPRQITPPPPKYSEFWVWEWCGLADQWDAEGWPPKCKSLRLCSSHQTLWTLQLGSALVEPCSGPCSAIYSVIETTMGVNEVTDKEIQEIKKVTWLIAVLESRMAWLNAQRQSGISLGSGSDMFVYPRDTGPALGSKRNCCITTLTVSVAPQWSSGARPDLNPYLSLQWCAVYLSFRCAKRRTWISQTSCTFYHCTRSDVCATGVRGGWDNFQFFPHQNG